METYFSDYLRTLEVLVDGFRQAVRDLPQEGLDWSPGPEMNSITVLVVHTAASLRYWIGDVALGEPADRNREAEFRTQGMSATEIMSRLEASLDYARSGLPKLSLEDLGSGRVAGRDRQYVTCGWALLHALEHTAQHVAHAQLTRQLWDQT